MMSNSRISALTGTSPAVWDRRNPQTQLVNLWLCVTDRKERMVSLVTTARFRVKARGMAWFGGVSTERREGEKADFVRIEYCALAWKGWSTFPPTSLHNNHSAQVAAKAAALIEETVTSCDAAAYTWHSSITESLHSILWSDQDIQTSILTIHLWSTCSQLGQSPYLLSDTLLPWHCVTAMKQWAALFSITWSMPTYSCQQKTTWNSPVLW